MALSLPERPSIENLRNRAKTLLREVHAREPDALARVDELYPGADLGAFKLADAQLVTARLYGLASWTKLKERLDVIHQFAGRPDTVERVDAPADEFLRLACLTYGSDSPARREEAERLLVGAPELARSSIHAAAGAGNVEAVRGLLARDSSLVNARGGPFRWEPLLYAAYSRAGDARGTVEVARELLAAGADPNAGYLWDASYAYTALTGVFGEGDLGPVNQPEHAHALEFARMLLKAGADPNDMQVVYNRQFTGSDDWLQLLLEFGLSKPSPAPWWERLGAPWLESAMRTKPELLQYLVHSAAVWNFPNRVRLLVEHGADVNQASDFPLLRQLTVAEKAASKGHVEIVQYIELLVREESS